MNSDGLLGPVCDDSWSSAEAMVICRQLGFPSAKSYTIGSYFGKVSSKFAIDSLNCVGNETSLNQCQFELVDDCNGQEAAGVVCDYEIFEVTTKSQDLQVTSK